MQAMVLDRAGQPLRPCRRETPSPGPREVLLRVRACGVCRTDLHVADGELPSARLPLVLGHEIVGEVARVGTEVSGLQIGQRLGVPWLGSTCGRCRYCLDDAENLCDRPSFTGYTRDGGYAEYTIADPRFCLPIPESYGDAEAAPLLCAGLIGYRAYRIAGEAECLGLYGFGAAAHILAQIARHDGREVYAFTRPGDDESQEFARRLGAVWAGGSDETPPVELDAAILFAPVGWLVPAALGAVRKGGTVLCAGIHTSEIPAFPYELLWGERVLRSVANLTRADGIELFRVAPTVPVETAVRTFPLGRANDALAALRHGELQGAAVLVPS
jgi:propanol-preferring alcohol dehydrogenase